MLLLVARLACITTLRRVGRRTVRTGRLDHRVAVEEVGERPAGHLPAPEAESEAEGERGAGEHDQQRVAGQLDGDPELGQRGEGGVHQDRVLPDLGQRLVAGGTADDRGQEVRDSAARQMITIAAKIRGM